MMVEKRGEDGKLKIWISRERKELWYEMKIISHNYLRTIIWWKKKKKKKKSKKTKRNFKNFF